MNGCFSGSRNALRVDPQQIVKIHHTKAHNAAAVAPHVRPSMVESTDAANPYSLVFLLTRLRMVMYIPVAIAEDKTVVMSPSSVIKPAQHDAAREWNEKQPAMSPRNKTTIETMYSTNIAFEAPSMVPLYSVMDDGSVILIEVLFMESSKIVCTSSQNIAFGFEQEVTTSVVFDSDPWQ